MKKQAITNAAPQTSQVQKSVTKNSPGKIPKSQSQHQQFPLQPESQSITSNAKLTLTHLHQLKPAQSTPIHLPAGEEPAKKQKTTHISAGSSSSAIVLPPTTPAESYGNSIRFRKFAISLDFYARYYW